DLALAHPGLLRARAALGGVARRRARVLLPRRAALLVAGDSALAEPRDLAALGHASLPSAGRSPEHGSLGAAHLLRSRALPELRAVAALLRDLAAPGSGGGGSDHVGSGLRGVLAAARLDRSRAARAPRARALERGAAGGHRGRIMSRC